MLKTKNKKLNLKVLFDTNVIYTGSASDLLRQEISTLIADHASLSDINITWYIPEVVLKERIFQMNKKGNELLIPIQKLEKLLGHNLNINKNIIEGRIIETINQQLIRNNLKTLKINTDKVDWESIIHNSLNRLAPFEDNEKEKGFRDALILECLKQLIADSPTTKTICRIIFITNDIALNNAATQLANNHSNISIYSNPNELISLINILDSEIREELINQISLDASKLFFQKDNESSLYNIWGVTKQIKETFSTELNNKQDTADKRENGTWWISKPGFEKKIRQTITWKTIISVDFTNYRTSMAVSGLNSLNSGFNTGIASRLSSGITSGFGTSITDGVLSGLNSPFSQNIPEFTTTKHKVGEGQTRFEVLWSVTLTIDNKLKKPKIESIKYLDTIFV